MPVLIAFRILDCDRYCHRSHCDRFYCACFVCRDDRKANEDAQQSNVDHHSFGISYHATRGDTTSPSPSHSTTSSQSLPIAPSPTIHITIRTTTTLPWRGSSSALLTPWPFVSFVEQRWAWEYYPEFCKLYVAVWTFEILSDYSGFLWEAFVCWTELHVRACEIPETCTKSRNI